MAAGRGQWVFGAILLFLARLALAEELPANSTSNLRAAAKASLPREQGQTTQLSAGSQTNQCDFAAPPADTPYYWDPSCEMGMLGCWADGKHAECRFCGEAPYTSVLCPETAIQPPYQVCRFDNPPVPRFSAYWEPSCKMGMKGCMADGRRVQCRWCGMDGYSDIPCPDDKKCTFLNEPATPYYWDPECRMGKLGCFADGLHQECRFCAKRPFESVRCPDEFPPAGKCHFPVQPGDRYYWDPTCQLGMVGCWADSFHAECRFCGGDGAYASVPCPED